MTPSAQPPELGLVGLGVMGRNLALNVADHGHPVVVWNRRPEVQDEFLASARSVPVAGAADLADLVKRLERPRIVFLMVTAGSAVDSLLEDLKPHLAEGDIVIDGGNTWFRDTQRRERDMRFNGFRFFGVGVSGGEEGARHGPSLMPGGDRGAYEHLRPIFEDIAAVTESGPCVTLVGSDGAGHFVKMVHNGIEYADMQLIAESYDLLRRGGGLGPDDLAATFQRWNEGPLESFLIEITGKILAVRDPETGEPLVDHVLDAAGQKGTGRQAAQIALELAVPAPTIAAAIDARVLSSMKEERVRAEPLLRLDLPDSRLPKDFARVVHDALHAAKICAYAQGMALVARASAEYGWNVDLRELARIWKGGCIIRARFLDAIMEAFGEEAELPNLLVAPTFRAGLSETHAALREAVAAAAARGVPAPALSASLAYLDAYRTDDLPQNLVQAQRDAFGAHGYVRRGDAAGEPVHTNWLSRPSGR